MSDTVAAAAVDAVVVEVVEVDRGGGATQSEGDNAVRESLLASQLATHGRPQLQLNRACADFS